MRHSRFAIALLLVMSLLSLYAQPIIAAESTTDKDQKTVTIKVFWVGNSYTASGNIPKLVQSMMAEGKTKYRMEETHHWVGGIGWDYHVEETDVMQKIASGDYDYVVLQDFSYAPTHRKDKMRKFGKVLADQIKQSGATPIFYNTWAKAHLPHETEEINSMYNEVALKNDGIIAPVGAAWKLVIDNSNKHDLTLFRPDKSHPSAQGTYLNACVFYSVFTGKSPVGLKLRTTKPYGFGKKNLEKYRKENPKLNNDAVTHTDKTAKLLQQAAWKTIQQYQKENKVPVTIFDKAKN